MLLFPGDQSQPKLLHKVLGAGVLPALLAALLAVLGVAVVPVVVLLVLLVLALLALLLALDVHLDLLPAAAEHPLQITRVPLQQSAGLGAVGAQGHPQNTVGALADLHGDAAQMLRGKLDAHH